MAGNGFDRQVLNSRERPLSSDINAAQSQLDRTVREVVKSLFTSRVGVGSSDLSGLPTSGFIGDAFKVRESAVPGLSVVLSKGLGFQYLVDPATSVGGVGGVDDLSEFKPLNLLVDTTIAGIAAGDGANPRIDIIEVRMNRALGNPLSRDVLNPGTGVFVPTSVNKTLSFTQDGSVSVVSDPAASTAAVSYKQGIPGAVPVEPTVTAGYVKIATLLIPTAAASITKANIIDQRTLLCPYGAMPVSVAGSIPAGAAAPPTSLVSNVPPGVEVAVVKIAQPAQYRFAVFFLGGALGANAALALAGSVINSAGVPGTFNHLMPTLVQIGALAAPDIALLANAAISTPAATYPLGYPYAKVLFEAFRQQGATTDNGVPDPMSFAVSGVMHRY